MSETTAGQWFQTFLSPQRDLGSPQRPLKFIVDKEGLQPKVYQ